MKICPLFVIVLICNIAVVLPGRTEDASGLPRAAVEGAVPVSIARDATALQQVVIASDADAASKTAANELAEYLHRISGADFAVVEGDGTTGMAVGGFQEFPNLELAGRFTPDDPFRREEYVLRSHADGLYLIGATPAASRLAVWDLLFRLGHRQFFPTDKWEIVPSVPDIRVALDLFNKPDYANRRIWRGGRQWSFTDGPFENWKIRNRSSSGAEFRLSTGHAYGAIIRRNREPFDANPEFYAEINGKRENIGANTKFCIANAGLRKLVVDDAINHVRGSPGIDSISMDPSDGGNWCECKACAEMGSVSDRVTLLANDVAEAINALGLGDKYVGILAYASYSPPPSVRVHPKVIVSVSTSFLRGGFSAPELVEEWSKQGATHIGIREYYAISIWAKDLPGQANAVNFPYLKRTLPFFHQHGARFNSANIANSWGAYGLGFYLIAQLLFDVEAADRIDVLVDDFLTQSFGPARDPMERYYRLIARFDENERRPLFSEHLLGLMYRHLDAAMQKAEGHPDVIDRIRDLVLYTRYAELYFNARSVGGEERQAFGEEILRHMHAIRHSMMVNTRVITRGAQRRLPSFTLPEGEEQWDAIRTIDAYTPEQIDEMIAEGVANNTLMDFEPIEFSRDLVPAAEALGFPDVPEGSLTPRAPMARRIIYTWLDEPGEIVLRVRGGMISHYRNRGNVRITLHSPQDELVEGVAYDDSVPPDTEWHRVVMNTPFAGLHWIDATDQGDATFIFFEDKSLPYVIPSGREERFQLRGGRWTLYFYVPKGTETVGGYVTATRAGTIRDGDGNELFSFPSMEQAGFFNVPVPKGQDGKLWQVHRAAGQCYLMTVPPYYARTGREMLIPREVVERDQKPDHK